MAVSCLAITRYPVGQLKRFLSEETDFYNAKIALNIISNVVFMSMIMTVAGSWAGQGRIDMSIFQRYLTLWPRNFGIAFCMQSLIAQPTARFTMRFVHSRQTQDFVNEEAE